MLTNRINYRTVSNITTLRHSYSTWQHYTNSTYQHSLSFGDPVTWRSGAVVLACQNDYRNIGRLILHRSIEYIDLTSGTQDNSNTENNDLFIITFQLLQYVWRNYYYFQLVLVLLFSTVLFIHTSDYLCYLRKKTVTPLPTTPEICHRTTL